MSKHRVENDVRDLFCNSIERCNGVAFKVHGHLGQEPGWPDIYMAHRDWNGWIEFKRDGGAMTTLQYKRAFDLYRLKVPVMLFWYFNATQMIYVYNPAEFMPECLSHCPPHAGVALDAADLEGKGARHFSAIDLIVHGWKELNTEEHKKAVSQYWEDNVHIIQRGNDQ